LESQQTSKAPEIGPKEFGKQKQNAMQIDSNAKTIAILMVTNAGLRKNKCYDKFMFYMHLQKEM
jgi:hypothetical protein